MPLSIFSPNKAVTGGAAFFSFNSKDGSVFVKLIKQIADNQNKVGNFDGQNPINVKLTEDEVGDIIRVIRTNSKSSFYHTFGEDKTTGAFNYWEMQVKDKQGNPVPKSGFGLTVTKNGATIKVGIGLGAAERLSEFLKFALDHIFSAEYAKDKKAFEERTKKKEDAAKKPVTKKVEKLAPEPTEETNDVENAKENSGEEDQDIGF